MTISNQTFNWKLYEELNQGVQFAAQNPHSQSVSQNFQADDGETIHVKIFPHQFGTEFILSCGQETIFVEDITEAAQSLYNALNTLPKQIDMFSYMAS